MFSHGILYDPVVYDIAGVTVLKATLDFINANNIAYVHLAPP